MISKYMKQILRFLLKIIPLQNKVVLDNFYGNQPGDNPKYIARLLLKQNIKVIWLVREKLTTSRENETFVRVGSLASVYHVMTAKVWIDNVRKREGQIKRRGQLYIQTWHGEPLKKIENDVSGTLDMEYIRQAKKDSEMIDYILSESKLSYNAFKNSFWYDGKILNIGSPRLDIFNWSKKDKNKILDQVNKKFGLENNDNIIVYMPTFRNDHSADVYLSNYTELINKVTDKFKGTWKILIKLHPNVANDSENTIVFSDVIIDASEYGDPQELILRSQLLITDYSSVMFDGMMANKKVILLAKDLKQYLLTNRSMYLRYDELPFPIAMNEEKLLFNINNFNEHVYFDDINSFKNLYQFVDINNASEIVTKIILEFMQVKTHDMQNK